MKKIFVSGCYDIIHAGHVQFFIDKKGTVTEAYVAKGVPGTGLDEAALDAVLRSKWYPAKQREKKVGVWQTVPVKFVLK